MELGHVTANDPDSSFIEYYLVEEHSPKDVFIVEVSGSIKLLRELDRESCDIWKLVVGARGAYGPSATVPVEIVVGDINDNAPNIIFPSYKNITIHVPYGTPQSHLVSRVLATDADYGENSKLLYFIEKGDPDGFFKMDTTSGVISTNIEVINTQSEIFNLLIRVQDRGSPPKTALTDMDIVINKSISISFLEELPPNAHGGIFNRNSYILVIMTIVTIFLVIILILAIIFVKTKQSTEDTQYDKTTSLNIPLDVREQNEPLNQTLETRIKMMPYENYDNNKLDLKQLTNGSSKSNLANGFGVQSNKKVSLL